MAKKQRQERTSSQPSSASVSGYQCAAAIAETGVGGGGGDLAPAENLFEGLFSGEESFLNNSTINLSAFEPCGMTDGSLDLSYITSPLVLSTKEFMHKAKTTQPEQDNTGQQPRATVAGHLLTSVASSTAFPDVWFERPYFPGVASSLNTSHHSALASGIGSGSPFPHQILQGAYCSKGGQEGRGQGTASSHSSSSSLTVTDSSIVKDSSGSISWRARNEMTTQQPSTSSSTYQSHEPSNKRRKKRSSGSSSVDIFSDSEGSDDDDDDDDGSLSDIDEDEGAVRTNSQQFAAKFLKLRTNGKPCNFWQYNSQARGPKGRRIYGEITLKDCHVLDEFSDPVSHDGSGKGRLNKLRHGEGNDPHPDPQKLMEIGSHISRLEEEFQVLSAAKSGGKGAGGDEVGRQKNKLASRICRLKKKAQHEANKVKLEGLREEHEQLVAVVARLVTIMERHILTTETTRTTSAVVTSQPSFCSQLESLIGLNLKFMIAGHTVEYVNMQLQKLAERLSLQPPEHLRTDCSASRTTC